MRRWSSVGGSKRLLAAFVAVALISFGLGAIGTHLIRSPAQVAADRKAPARTNLTAMVTKGNLESSVRFIGTVSAGKTVTLSPADADGKIVTGGSPRKGTSMAAGSVVVELNDRPVVLLVSKYPLYRDLSFGSQGDDVARLQDALRNANYGLYDAPGKYGASTAAAVQRLYANAGYSTAVVEEASYDDGSTSDKSSDEKSSSKSPRRYAAIKRAEILMVPALPADLANSTFKSGNPVSKGEVTIALSAPIITAKLNPVEAEGLSKGQKVTYSSVDEKVQGSGTIESIGEPKVSGDDGFVSIVKVRPDVTLDSENESESLTIDATSTEKQSGLLVPLSAIYTSAGGDNSVQIFSGGKKVKIKIDVVSQADGLARVESKKLAAGDRVVVGIS